ncbi:RNA 2',3'-cyclic phosphodiesterase [Corynebacterium sp.]|uniref:RNA 2',3'-cyclic phosphodiesterase n=1 Tax=Corynebacterium sp. TaxID=1720 RepID=UPI0026DFD116|nr:RNA 2',3'-cyclic phosphodiesterase [Corynebacterium sp.]MDO5511763.1 RNA 2',3'-cyclic phosphodiesterase [Corynebacterium sp.]
MKRLFSALLISPEAREHLVHTLRPIREAHPRGLRWTDPDNWHITVAFHGQMPNDHTDLLGHLAQAAAASSPMTLRLHGAGSFGHRTLWMGVGGEVRPLKSLMADTILEEPAQPQKPHLTIARTQERWLVGDLVHALAVYEGPTFLCEELALMESRLGEGRSGGPRYEVLERVRLG